MLHRSAPTKFAMRLRRPSLVALFLLAASHLTAGVSLIGQVGRLFKADAATQVPIGSIAILVADTDKASHAGLVNPLGTTLAVGSTLGGSSGDLIVGVYRASDLGDGVVGVDLGGTTLTYTGALAAGTDLWLMWFPTIEATGGTVGAAVPYGAYSSSVVDTGSGSDIAFAAPPDGATASLYAYTSSLGFGLASDLELSATLLTPGVGVPNAAPTGLTLSANSVNQSAGANAIVGTLATTDADSTSFTYTFVSGTGSTDNASFNLSGATLRANDPAALAPGSYSVRLQTADGNGVFAKAFMIVVTPRDYSGSYFGAIGAAGGHWALHVKSDGTATYLAYLPDRNSAIVVHLTVDTLGHFTVTGSEIVPLAAGDTRGALAVGGEGAPRARATATSFTLTGQIAGTTVSGQLGGLGVTFTGLADAGGSSAAGYYTASAIGAASGTTYAIVGPSGQTIVVTTSTTSIDGASGTVNSSGQLNATTAGGAQLSLAVSAQNQTVAATVTPAGSATPTTFAGLADTAVNTSRAVNIATRAYGSTGNSVTIGGFVVSGTVPKRVLIRAVGPTLTSQGIGQSEVMLDPTIEVHDALHANAVIATNDNWADNSNAAEIASTTSLVGAAALLGSDSKSAALLVSLAPGVYSFIVNGKAGTSGIVLLEVYDADSAGGGSTFTNIATRAYASTGNSVAIGGFVVSGNAPKRILVRAVGPTLSTMGLTLPEVLADPVIELHDALHGNAVIANNDNWGDNANATDITSTGARIGATPLAGPDTKSSALLLTLQPGVYSFIASGKSGTSGIVLVEVYDAD